MQYRNHMVVLMGLIFTATFQENYTPWNFQLYSTCTLCCVHATDHGCFIMLLCIVLIHTHCSYTCRVVLSYSYLSHNSDAISSASHYVDCGSIHSFTPARTIVPPDKTMPTQKTSWLWYFLPTHILHKIHHFSHNNCEQIINNSPSVSSILLG